MAKARWARQGLLAVIPALLVIGLGATGCKSGDARDPDAPQSPEKQAAPAQPAPAGAAPKAPLAPVPGAVADGKVSLSPPGNPASNEVLDKAGKDSTARASQDKAMAQHYYEVGKRLYDALEYKQAYDTLQKAVSLDPSNAAAVDLWERSGSILGLRQPELGGELERYRQEFNVKVQLAHNEMTGYYEAGEKYYNAGELGEAIRNLERAREMIQYYPYKIDTADYTKKTETLIAEAKRKKRQADLELDDARARAAFGHAQDEQKRSVESQNARIHTMLTQTQNLIMSRRYQEAKELAARILELEPQNPVAKKLYGYAVDGVHVETVGEDYRNMKNERDDDAYNTKESEIPYEGGPIIFPADFQHKVRFRKAGIAQEDVKEAFWITQYKRTLKERRVTLNFPEVPLKDVIQFLQEITGLNFTFGAGVDAEEKKVSLKLKEIVLENALNIIMQQTKLAYIFDKEAIIIVEAGKDKGDTYFDIYDVSDILYKINDFEGPRISIPNPSAPAGGGGGGNGPLIFGGGDSKEAEALSGDKIVELVKNSTGDDLWGEGTGIEAHRGQLLVTNTRDTHVKIADILNQLRSNQGLFVHVETRFVEITNDSLEDVGVDFRGLGANPGVNTSNAFGTPINGAFDPRIGGSDAGVSRSGSSPIGTPGTWRPGIGNGSNTGTSGPPPGSPTLGPGENNFIYRTQHIFDGTAGVLQGGRLAGGGGLTFLVTALAPFQVNAIIRAEYKENKKLTLTAPRVTAANRQKVFVSVLTQRAYIASYHLISGGTGLSVVEVPEPVVETFQEGVVLEVRPTISSDRKFVTLDVRPSLATLVGGTISTITVNLGSLSMSAIQVPIGIPQITLEEAFTSVTIPDGGTALLGGFRQVNQQTNDNSLPFIDNIPILNFFWKRHGEIKETQSLVILVKANVVSIRDEEAKRFNRPAR